MIVFFGDAGEFGFEDFARGSTRVLEVTKSLVGEEMQVAVGDHFFEGTLPTIRFGVLGTRQPTEKVGGTVVEFVWDKVVTDTHIGLAVFVLESRSRTIERESHKDVTVFAPCTTVNRISSVHIWPARLFCRTKIMRYFLSSRIEEIAVRMTPADDTAGSIEGHLFAALR